MAEQPILYVTHRLDPIICLLNIIKMKVTELTRPLIYSMDHIEFIVSNQKYLMD